MLYIISTPIGNLEDITLRALKTLNKADLILAEDTRKARILLGRYKVKRPTLSFYDYNKEKRIKYILSLLKDNKEIALISEAGTPGVSDPAYFLVKHCIKENIPYTALPGPTAAINALILSGLPTDRFMFIGFLSPKKIKRQRLFQELLGVKATLVFFESRYKIIKTVSDMCRFFGKKEAALVREMTKMHEEIMRAPLEVIYGRIQEKTAKGEYVIIIDNRP